MASNHINAELARAKNELDRARASLAAFASAAHHDLNAPLRHVRMFAELITRDETTHLSADATQYLQRISGSVDRAERLVDALSEYARLASAQPVFETLHLTAIANDVAGRFAEALEDVGASVEIDDLPVAHGDQQHVQRVLSCLLDNAIKHNQGRPVVIGLKPALAAEGQVAIEVRDDGPGLPDGQEESAFELLRQCSVSGPSEGLGMGLALSRQLMELMGGTISYNKGATTGASFLLTFQGAHKDGK